MSTSTDHQWIQFYQQIAMDEDHPDASSFAFSHATDVPVTAAAASENVLSPSSINSFSMMSDHQLVTPKDHHVSKPAVRRRSRASKKTPITLLNANSNNFRALVQQFTGCPSKTFSFASKKGPINLNFGHGNNHHHQNHHQSYAASVEAAFANINNHYPYNSNYYQQQQPQQQLLLQQQQQQQQMSCQEQPQGLVSLDIISDDSFFATTTTGGNIMNPNCGFAMDGDISSFHELTCSDESYFF